MGKRKSAHSNFQEAERALKGLIQALLWDGNLARERFVKLSWQEVISNLSMSQIFKDTD